MALSLQGSLLCNFDIMGVCSKMADRGSEVASLAKVLLNCKDSRFSYLHCLRDRPKIPQMDLGYCNSFIYLFLLLPDLKSQHKNYPFHPQT